MHVKPTFSAQAHWSERSPSPHLRIFTSKSNILFCSYRGAFFIITWRHCPNRSPSLHHHILRILSLYSCILNWFTEVNCIRQPVAQCTSGHCWKWPNDGRSVSQKLPCNPVMSPGKSLFWYLFLFIAWYHIQEGSSSPSTSSGTAPHLLNFGLLCTMVAPQPSKALGSHVPYVCRFNGSFLSYFDDILLQ